MTENEGLSPFQAAIKGVHEIIDCFDSAASFDPVDAAQFGWKHRPLFSSVGAPSQPPSAGNEFDWCFIGTLHSDRHRVIHRLRQRGGPGAKPFVFGYCPSQAMLWARHLADWTLWRAPPGTLSTVAISSAAVQGIVARSRVVLDIEHPHQRGLTMRTIETLLAGHKLVTTNQHIADCDLYHASRVHIISRQTPRIPVSFLHQTFEPLPARLRVRYSCTGWAQELLEQAQTAHALALAASTLGTVQPAR